MNYITYLAHGAEGYINECRFSLLRFLHVYNLQPPADVGVVIYTDKPQAFENFIPFFKQFHLEEVNDELLRHWIDATGYVHRAKTEMIKAVITKYRGNVIFFDTDTYITSPVENLWADISAGTVYLHQCEGVIDRQRNPGFHKWDRFLQTANIRYGDNQFVYDTNFAVWNSGVFGLAPHYLPLLDDVLQLIDAIHKQFPKHITEQVAVSYCFGKAAPLKPAASSVAHYWNLKEFRSLLSRFFTINAEESISTLVKKAYHFDPLAMQEHKASFKALPFWRRLLKKLTATDWKIERYERKV